MSKFNKKLLLLVFLLGTFLLVNSCDAGHCIGWNIGIILGGLILAAVCFIIPVVGPFIGVFVFVALLVHSCSDSTARKYNQCGCSMSSFSSSIQVEKPSHEDLVIVDNHK